MSVNITYMIGNGFDIGLGLKTSYKDFLDWYLVQPSKNSVIERFKQELDKSKDTWADLEVALGQITNKYAIDESEDFFEGKDDLQQHLMQFLASEQTKFNVNNQDIGIFLSQMRWCRRRVNTLLREKQWEKLYVDSRRGLIFRFINFNYTNILNSILIEIRKKSDLLAVSTNVYGGRVSDELTQPIWVHGQITRTPIMGVNDITQIANPSFANDEEISGFLVKHELDERSDRGFEEKAINAIEQSDIICVYGMSLGETDKMWWDLLMNWLIKDENHYIAVFMHDSKYETINVESNERVRYRIHSKIKEKLLSGWHESEKYEYLKKHIICVVNHDIFDIKIIKKPEDVSIKKEDKSNIAIR